MADFKEIQIGEDGQVYHVKDDTARQSSGGYTPPAGGIPKTDLASDVQTSLGKADTALQSADKSELQTAITSLQNALNTLIGSGNVQGAIDTFNEVKAFLDGIDTDDQTLANQLLALNNAISAVQTSLTAKANSADVYSKSEVDTKVADAGKVKSVSVNGTKHTPDTNGDVDLGNLRGQDGNSGVASADGVESVNNLNGGTTDTTSRVYVLGANQGKRLRDQMELVYQRVQTLYDLLGNIAFWEGKPDASTILPELDWGNPKHTVTLSLSLTNAVVKHNGVVKSNGDTILVEEGGTLTLVVEAASGYALASVTSATTGATVIDLGNGTYSVELAIAQSNVSLAISASSVRTYNITYGTMQNCSVAANAPTSVLADGAVNIQFNVSEGFALTDNAITVVNASKSFNASTNVLTISNPTGDVGISASAVTEPIKMLRGYYIGSDNKTLTNVAVGDGSLVDVNKVVTTDYIHITGDSNSALKQYYIYIGINRLIQQNASAGPPCSGSFFRKQNGTYRLINSWAWPGNDNKRTCDIPGSSYASELLAALQADELYVRSSFYLDSINPDVLGSDRIIKWGDDVLFSASTDGYTITTDQNEFDAFTV